jgi:hypothetical protein
MFLVVADRQASRGMCPARRLLSLLYLMWMARCAHQCSDIHTQMAKTRRTFKSGLTRATALCCESLKLTASSDALLMYQGVDPTDELAASV